jgi:hypothetical protein
MSRNQPEVHQNVKWRNDHSKRSSKERREADSEGLEAGDTD